ncbi:MAG: ABC transporter ATP-binding protein [Caldilineaceae bacterium]
MSYLIEAKNLRKTYGDFVAVDDASFSVNPGEIVGFLGPNGAGKTTTIKMLTGLLVPDAGAALICGLDIQQDPIKAKAQFAFVPDTPNLYGKLKAGEYLRFMARLYHVPTEQADTRIRQLLDLFELTDKAGSYLEGFSHGMQQKIAITGALLHDPKILFMDEPTVGLDPRSARLVKDLLQQRRDDGSAVFFSTHILEIAQNMCDRVIIIDRGRILADAPVADLRRMKGDQSLEDIFLELTGGKEVDEMVKELSNGG